MGRNVDETPERLIYRKIFSWLEMMQAERRVPERIKHNAEEKEKFSDYWHFNMLSIVSLWTAPVSLNNTGLSRAISLAEKLDSQHVITIMKMLEEVKVYMIKNNLR